ncbi:MAG TPA: hypothetical protein DD429_03645 [Clostridiaceae bacterium]|nr:hypothetical protein [Clostridiaceae bacterium]
MDLQKTQAVLDEIFGDKYVKPYTKGFKIIVEYDNMPYCIGMRAEQNRLMVERDPIDQKETNYENAYKKAYKMLIHYKNKFDYEIVIC